MPRIAIIGVETSHAERWLEKLAPVGMPVSLCPVDATLELARPLAAFWQAPILESMEEAAAGADIVAILNANWDEHVPLAEFFLKCGKTVYIDKPVACRDSDLDALTRLSLPHLDRLVLGSSNRFDPRLASWRKRRGELTRIRSMVGQPDPFGYGIHAVEMGQAVAGEGARAVRWLGSRQPFRFSVEHNGGFEWIVETEHSEPRFSVFVASSTASEKLEIRGGAWHGALIDHVLEVHAGAKPLTSAAEAVEAIRILRAAHTSAARGGDAVSLSDELLTFSGSDYVSDYLRRRKEAAPGVRQSNPPAVP